jgi:hypothetical protein
MEWSTLWRIKDAIQEHKERDIKRGNHKKIVLSRFFVRAHYTRKQSLVFFYFIIFKYLPVTFIVFPLIELYMWISNKIIMEYRHLMEAYFKMIYVRSYHEMVNSPDGVEITIHKRNNALKSEKELNDIGIEFKNGKFIGKINNVDAEVLFQNMVAKPAIEQEQYFKTITVNSKDDINIIEPEKETNENIEKE